MTRFEVEIDDDFVSVDSLMERLALAGLDVEMVKMIEPEPVAFCGAPTVQAGTDGFCTLPAGHEGYCITTYQEAA